MVDPRDGSWVVAGDVSPRARGQPWRLLLLRFSASGDPDEGFNHRASEINRRWSGAWPDLTLLDDGSIVVAASVDRGPFLVKFTRKGTLDEAFGNGGVAEIPRPPPQPDSSPDLALLASSDGGILAGFTITSGSEPDLTYVYSVKANGVVRHDFGRDGVLRIRGDFPVLSADARGYIWAASTGYRFSASRATELRVERYRPDGKRDRSFGANGTADLRKLFPQLQSKDEVSEIRADHSGGLMLAIEGPRHPGHAFCCDQRLNFVQLTPAGRPDADFGGDGVASMNFDVYVVDEFELDRGGGVVGVAVQSSSYPSYLFSWSKEGVPDRRFGSKDDYYLADARFDKRRAWINDIELEGASGIAAVGQAPQPDDSEETTLFVARYLRTATR